MEYRLVRNLVLQYLEENLAKLKEEQTKVVEEVLRILREKGYRITPELEEYVSQVVKENAQIINSLITRSALLATQHLGITSKAREILKEIENHEYPDGLNLSERLWKRQRELKQTFKEVLFRNLRARESAKKIAYEFQYTAERKPFEKLTEERLPKLVQKLEQTAKKVIAYDPEAKKEWERLIRRYKRYTEQRSKLGTYYAHKTLLRELSRAVEELSDKAVEEAVRWWAYDKQLYYLNRIARTEVSNVIHLSILKETEKNEFIIGYRWELSPAHRRPDICDHLANVDFGLGKGVFPKSKVPRRKPHPHCTCHITPIAGDPEKVKVKEKPLKEHIKENPQVYEQWLYTRRWAKELYKRGVPLEEFFDEKTLRMKTREEMKEWEKLIEIKPKIEELLGAKKAVDVRIGQSVQISRYPKRERVKGIVKDPFGYEFFYTDYRVKHSLRIPSKIPHRKKRKKEQDIPYIMEGWKLIREAFQKPDGIAIYEEGKGLVYAKKVKDRYVLFAFSPKKRAIETAFVKSLLEDTPSYIFLYRRHD